MEGRGGVRFESFDIVAIASLRLEVDACVGERALECRSVSALMIGSVRSYGRNERVPGYVCVRWVGEVALAERVLCRLFCLTARIDVEDLDVNKPSERCEFSIVGGCS